MDRLIITLDGPAGSGKSSVAWRLAKRLGVQFLDTGAMYRGLTAHCLDRGIDPASDATAVADLAPQTPMRFDWAADPPRLFVADHDITHRLRDDDVGAAVSELAAIPEVRKVMVQTQRRIAEHHPRLVTEGRDQGSVVFPGAHIKFYLDAHPTARARRRAEQTRQAGQPADEADVLLGIVDRDHKDTSRADSPLRCPSDARRIDTTDLSLDQVVDLLEQQARTQLADALGPPTTTDQRAALGGPNA